MRPLRGRVGAAPRPDDAEVTGQSAPQGVAQVRLTGVGRWTAGSGTVAAVLGGAGGWSPVFAVGVTALAACAAAWTSRRVISVISPSHLVADVPPAASYTRGQQLTVTWAQDAGRGRRTGPSARAGGNVRTSLRSALPGGGPDTVVVGPGSRTVVAALPRGVWRLGPAVAEHRDALGLAMLRTAPSPPSAPFTVRPRTAGDVPWAEEAWTAHASAAGRLDTDEAFEIHGLRPYLPGDDVRFVDRRASLLAGSFQIRELRGGGHEPATAVLLDTAVSGEAFETAVDCAATVAVSVLRRGRPVLLCGLGVRGERGGDALRVGPGPGAVDRALDALARCRPRHGAPPAALARTVTGLGGGAPAVLATPRDPALWRPLLTALSARRATVVCLHAVPAAVPGAAAAPPPQQAPGFRIVRVGSADDLTAPLAGSRTPPAGVSPHRRPAAGRSARAGRR